MVSELMESSAAGYPLEGLMFGGAPAHHLLPAQAKKMFPKAAMSVLSLGVNFIIDVL
jgi:hypothetical protein